MVPRITWRDLEYSLAPNGAVKIGWLTALFGLGTGNTLLDPDAEMTDDLGEWYFHAVENNEVPQDAIDAFEARSVKYRDVDTPAFFLHGWNDSLFNPSEALHTHEQLLESGTESRLLFYEGGHDLSEVTVSFENRERMNDHALTWLDRHVRGEDVDIPHVQNYLPQRDTWREDEQWPPADVTTETYEFSDASRDGDTDLEQGLFGWFTNEEVTYEWTLADDVEVIGEPTIELSVDVHGNEAILFFELFHNGSNINGMDEAYRIRASGTNQISVTYPGIQRFISEGDTLGVNVSVSNTWYQDARDSDGVTIDSGGSRLQILQRPDENPDSGSGGDGPGFTAPAVAAGVGGAALLSKFRGEK